MKKHDKRQQIIETAISLFVTQGIHSTSIQTLSKTAGIATGSIYTYFDSKDTLVLEAFRAVIAESIEAATQGYDPNRSIQSRFYFLLQQKIHFNLANPDKFRYINLCAYEPLIMHATTDTGCEDSPLTAVLEAGQAEQLIKNLPLPELFYQMFGGLCASLEWRLSNQHSISDTDIDNMIEMAWDTIRKTN